MWKACPGLNRSRGYHPNASEKTERSRGRPPDPRWTRAWSRYAPVWPEHVIQKMSLWGHKIHPTHASNSCTMRVWSATRWSLESWTMSCPLPGNVGACKAALRCHLVGRMLSCQNSCRPDCRNLMLYLFWMGFSGIVWKDRGQNIRIFKVV